MLSKICSEKALTSMMDSTLTATNGVREICWGGGSTATVSIVSGLKEFSPTKPIINIVQVPTVRTIQVPKGAAAHKPPPVAPSLLTTATRFKVSLKSHGSAVT